MKPHFGKTVEDARKAKGWRQEDLAERLGVTQQAVQKWEGAEDPPFRSKSLPELCALLGIEQPEQPPTFAEQLHAKRRSTEPTPLSRSPRVTYHFPPPKELYDQIHDLLPEDLQRNARQAVMFNAKPYLFAYVSPRVVMAIVPGTPNGPSPMSTRAIAWRLMVARMANNDGHISSRHYAVMTMRLPAGEPETGKLTLQLRKELELLNIQVFECADPVEIRDNLIALEQQDTEMDSFMAAQIFTADDDFDDLL